MRCGLYVPGQVQSEDLPVVPMFCGLYEIVWKLRRFVWLPGMLVVWCFPILGRDVVMAFANC